MKNRLPAMPSFPMHRVGLAGILFVAIAFHIAHAESLHSLRVASSKAEGGAVTFDYRIPKGNPVRASILVLVPGYNGSGRSLLSGFWADFADRNGTILLAPTFHTTLKEIQDRTGYYYPAVWSGEVLLEAVDQLARKTGAEVKKFFLYGHSAGAHFAHRFALWRPERVGAFVAYSAAWWDPPTPAIRSVPALILCGELDMRYDASLQFFQEGRALQAPWVWRGYRNTGHEVTPTVLRMAAAFLEHYLSVEPDVPLAGDLQTYTVTDWEERDTIPEDALVRLPSQTVATIWVKEN